METLAQTLELKLVDSLINDKEYAKAENILLKALVKFPKNVKTREYLADVAAFQQNWGKAIPVYKSLLKNEQTNANYHFKYAAALAMEALEMPKVKAVFYIPEIKSHLFKAANLDPEHIEVRWALLELYLQLPTLMGGGEKAAMVYAVELEKISTVDGFLAKGHLYETLGKFEAAEIHYISAVKTGGSLHCYEKLFALYLYKLKQPKNAINSIEEALKNHCDPILHLKIAEIAYENKIYYQKAVKHLEYYISKFSEKGEAIPKTAIFLRNKLYEQQDSFQ